MTSVRHIRSALVLLLLLVAGCGSSSDDSKADYAYVSVPEAQLRDRVAAVYNKVGPVKNGDKVRILERSANKRFARVRTPDGHEGWLEQRYLVGQEIYDAFQKLAHDNAGVPAQAVATTRLMMNMHVQPARDAEKLYQIASGSKVDLVRRTSTPKEGMKALRREEKEKKDQAEADAADNDAEVKEPEASPLAAQKPAAEKKRGAASPASAPPTPLEDWWLVRDANKRIGWVLGRMLDVEVPLEIAQYAEGQRIVAASPLNAVKDPSSGKQVSQYVVLMSENRDGLPYDFSQLRVFTWNGRRSRYETAYRERNLNGVLPFAVGKEDFGKDGVLPTFTIHEKDESGKVFERKYKMNGVMVRRVLAPGEEPVKIAHRSRKSR